MTPIRKFDGKLPSKPDKSKEKELAALLKEMLDAQQAIDDALDERAKAKPVLKDIVAAADKLRKMATGRAAELKDLQKEAKRGLLHSNPSKLERLIKDFRQAVEDANALQASWSEALNTHFGAAFNIYAVQVAKALPSGFDMKRIDLATKLKNFKAKQIKEGWSGFDASAREAFFQRCVRDANENLRVAGIEALRHGKDFALLKRKAKDKVIDAGIKDGTSVADVRLALDAAFQHQDFPSLARWRSYLALGSDGGYRMTSASSYMGSKIHITMSKDSWTADADGKVSLSGGTAEKCLEQLLQVTDWKQLHATLEVTSDAKDYPHVFLYAGVLGNDTRWPAAHTKLGAHKDWIKEGQKAMKKELDAFKSALVAKIKNAQQLSGPVF